MMVIINMELLWYYIGEGLKFLLLAAVIICAVLQQFMISIICALVLLYLLGTEIRDILLYGSECPEEEEDTSPPA